MAISALWLLPPSARADDLGLGGVSLLAEPATQGAFPLVDKQGAASLVVAESDWAGVRRAAGDLQTDIERVTGRKPGLTATATAGTAVIIGTVGKSALIDGLVAASRLDVTAIRGKWEAFLIETVERPLPGVERALVIAGSDKRGTIYGIYELSQQIGVSPWYWWADVPVTRRETLFIKPGRQVNAGPVVKYRGIFLNDEAPALTGWTKEKFGGFNHKFYAHVFELMLRLRGNYLWPAMWLPQAFNDDDPANARLADEYGIVMGTSHHEPLMRAHAEWGKYGRGPWDYSKNGAILREFWRGSVERTKDYENIQSLGMRGDGDEAMSAETNTALLERIVADQRKILTEVTGKKVEDVPQLWALYKEVQDYYERGMRVPDDVTLLWCDDNWGNIRRLPTPEERKRPGGAGVYYHFDYVGGPRNYKWLNVTPITKIWEQMHLAWKHGATRIWIVNVGDLKPMEFPIEFFLTMAWDPARWPYEKLTAYSKAWAAREFGSVHAVGIAALINGYTKLNRRRTPELLAVDTYSLVNYREAERVLAEWRDLVARAEKIEALLPSEAHAAFLQLVRHPVQASANHYEVLMTAGLNRLHASQGRASANTTGNRARELFARDAALTRRWDAMLDGKWRHMMDQVHFGYTIWQQPVANVMPLVAEVQVPDAGVLALAVEGDPAARPGNYPVPAVAKLPPLSSLAPDRTRWVDLFNRGAAPVRFTVEASEPWLRISAREGEVGPDVRIEVGADWSAVPMGSHTARLTVRGGEAAPLVVEVPVDNPVAGRGFLETDGHVSIEAPHFTRAVTSGGIEWRMLPDFGRTVGGVTAFPVTAPVIVPGGDTPRLEYQVHLASAGEVAVQWTFAPSLDFQSGEGLRFAVSFDDEAPRIMKLGTWSSPAAWDRAVSDSARRVTTLHKVAQPGGHVLKFWLVTPGVVLEKILINPDKARPSYLGPPESPRGRPSAAADQPVMRGDANSQLAHEQLLQKARAGGISVYFLGDSITRRWGATDYPDFLANWKRNFHGWNAGNFGWGGDTTRNILWRLHHGELDGVNPKVIVLLAGTNNIGRDPNDEAKVADITRGITAIVDLCRAKAPGATIILMGIFPRNDHPVMPLINRINANLARLADGKTVRYLNINDRLAGADGTLFDGMSEDRLHLTLKSYQVWADALKPLLTELLGPPAATDTAPPPTGDPGAKN